MKKQSPVGRIWELVEKEHGKLITAVILAVIGIACGMAPYFAAAKMIGLLLSGESEFSAYLPWLLTALAGFLLRTALYNGALGISHAATYNILKIIIRQKLLAKLPRLTLGTVMDTSSGKLKEIPIGELYDQVAFVSQDNYLFDDTVRENIRMGRRDATDAEVEEAARKAGCAGFIGGLEKCFDTIVGGGGAHLSGGERQRIAIARAMLKDAPVIILDEATAYIDPENEDRLQKAIEALTRNKTIIMIAHRLKTVRHADRILVIDHGRIVQQGKHEELIAEPGIYADFIGGKKQTVDWKL